MIGHIGVENDTEIFGIFGWSEDSVRSKLEGVIGYFLELLCGADE